MARELKKVYLFNINDHGKHQYRARPTLHVEPIEGSNSIFRWRGEIDSLTPIAWTHAGERRETVQAEAIFGESRPWARYFPDVAEVSMPREVQVSQDSYLRMSPEEQAKVRAAQDAWRAAVSTAHAQNPQPDFVLERAAWSAEMTKDDADTAAQKWAIETMKKYKRPVNTQRGHTMALPLGLGALGPIGLLLDLFRRLAVKGIREILLLAVAYSTTIRNNMLTQVQTAIDLGAGAGKYRGYDGTRPATGGTATTLLFECTFTDPAAAAPSGGVLTFSAITADASADATGTTTWGRAVDSTATFCLDQNHGTSGSDMNFNTTSITVGLNVAVSSWTITEGNP
jgi:hypothetical protein